MVVVVVAALAMSLGGCNRDYVPAGIEVLLGRVPVREIRRLRGLGEVGSRKVAAAGMRLRQIHMGLG